MSAVRSHGSRGRLSRGHASTSRGPAVPNGRSSRELEEEYGPPSPPTLNKKLVDAIPPATPRMVDRHLPFTRVVAWGGQTGKPGRGPSPVEGGGGGGGPSPAPDPQAVSKESFRDLLENFEKKEGGMSCYQISAEIQARLGLEYRILKVNFDHLLKYKQYVGLATEVTRLAINNPEHSWLQSTAQDFLNAEFKLEGNEKQQLGFCFQHEASSVKPLCEYKTSDLVKRQSVFGGLHQLLKTTHKGRHVYLAVLNNMLAVHRSGKAWDGDFNMADIYIVEYKNSSKMECVIYANTIDLNEGDHNVKVRDLQMLNTLLTPKYKDGDEYPPYIVDLKADLEQLTCSKLRDTGFLSALPFHLALMSPAARSFLLCKLHLVTQMLSRNGIDFGSIFNRRVRRDKLDWRLEYKNSADGVLNGVYNHQNLGEDKFSNNVKGMFEYKRHLVQHAHNHPAKNPVCICNADETELFAAWKVPLVLPIIVKYLFSGTSMKFRNELGSVWSDYCKMCYNDDEDNVATLFSETPAWYRSVNDFVGTLD